LKGVWTVEKPTTEPNAEPAGRDGNAVPGGPTPSPAVGRPSAGGLSPLEIVEALGREFFAALDARDPRRLRHTLAANATFRAHPHSAPIRPADEIVAYFGTVVSSYPTARWEVTDVISDGERAAVQFTLREFASDLGRELISEQIAVFRANAGRITSIVGYYDAEEFRRQFWGESAT
jgi:ketosteroid isomerase-like protein